MINSQNIEHQRNRRSPLRKLSFISLKGLLLLLLAVSLCHAEDFRGIQVHQGFQVSQFADDDFAHDVFSMTTDSLGRIVVAGPGYVRILVDDDHDGKADRYIQYADGPKNGAQGMYFNGRDLLCIGDQGLLRFLDRDADDRADGPPELLLKLKTGGEHHTHAIRKGPDGWWYIIAGNMAGITQNFVTQKSSPVTNPQAGVVLRINADFSKSEIISHGFRNAYDFDFNSTGDLLVYDSDGERDISLPWYRPTRVFHALPGTHAGWISASWKHPDYFFSMPSVVGSLGRGSPTGVVCYRHRSFPKKYRDALFVLDWTFGRIYSLPLKADGATWKSQPTIFMQATGEFGFAPTDAVVGPQGDLYISVGGRGTRGGVFRVRYIGKKKVINQSISMAFDPLKFSLETPQPHSSWARQRWVPQAKKIGSQPFLRAILDESSSSSKRLRAIDVVTELFGGLSAKQVEQLLKSPDETIRAKAIWSYGRDRTGEFDFSLLSRYLADVSPFVQRHTLEVLSRASSVLISTHSGKELVACLGSQNRTVRQAASRCLGKLDFGQLDFIQRSISPDNIHATIAFHVGSLQSNNQCRPKACRLLFETFLRARKQEDRIDALRAMQLAVGGVGSGAAKIPAVFQGYRSRLDLEQHRKKLNPIVAMMEKTFPTGGQIVDRELSRLIAMLQPQSSLLLKNVLARITEKSHPTDDVHHLIVASQIRTERNGIQSLKIAKALLNLEPKIALRKLNLDNNWDSRILETYRQLTTLDPALPLAIVKHEQFGLPSHIKFVAAANRPIRQLAIETITKRIRTNPDFEWSTQTVFLLGDSTNSEHGNLIRTRLGILSLQSAVLQVLARDPAESDREHFLTGLGSPRLEVLNACVKALQQLQVKNIAKENLLLFKTLRRLGKDRGEYAIREKVVRLLHRNTIKQFGFQFGRKGHNPQSQALGRWDAWLQKEYPLEYRTLFSRSSSASKTIDRLMSETRWDSGNIERGKKLFDKQACAQCHGRRRVLGPDLAGITSRFSRKDILAAIIDPNRDVSPRYQTTSILTTAGKIYSGLVIYDSVDGTTLRDSSHRTIRIEANKIDFKRKSSQSLMPEGLLKDTTPQDLADLFAYLKSLQK